MDIDSIFDSIFDDSPVSDADTDRETDPETDAETDADDGKSLDAKQKDAAKDTNPHEPKTDPSGQGGEKSGNPGGNQPNKNHTAVNAPEMGMENNTPASAFYAYMQKYTKGNPDEHPIQQNAQNPLDLGDKINHMEAAGSDLQPAVQEILRQMPEMQAIRAIAEQQIRRAQKDAFENELKKISEIDPSVTKAEDLENIENKDAFLDFVLNKGFPISDAFKLSQFDTLIANSARKAKQETINRVNSKQHLKPVSGVYGEEISVPDDIMEEYRLLNPDASDEEIKKHYKKSLKGAS